MLFSIVRTHVCCAFDTSMPPSVVYHKSLSSYSDLVSYVLRQKVQNALRVEFAIGVKDGAVNCNEALIVPSELFAMQLELIF